MSKAKILIVPGSLRVGSFNKKLAKVASDELRAMGVEATLIDLKDYPMPLFDEDIEAASGAPATTQALKELFIQHHGLLFVCPEYNSSITAVLKNTIDWLSRQSKGEPSLVAFRGKAVGLLSASTGALGGLRGLVTVRSILGNIGTILSPDQFALSSAHEAFSAEGTLKDPKALESVKRVVRSLADLAVKLG